MTRPRQFHLLDAVRSVARFRRPTLDRRKGRLTRCANTDDFRRWARSRLPGGVFDYIDGGAEGEQSLVENEAAFRRYQLVPRVLRDVEHVDTVTRLFGRVAAFPLVLAPTGFTRIADPEGELAVARAAQRAGIPYTLSTLSTRSIEDVATAAPDAELWFQVYAWRDRDLVRGMLDRATAAGYTCAMLTVDTPVLGRRERDIRRGFTLPPQLGLDVVLDGIRHPTWTWQLVTSEPIRFANVTPDGTRSDGADPVSLSDYVNAQFDASLTWHDVEWIREVWPGDLIVKGIHHVDDASQAVRCGADGVVLSNHGGRQVDGVGAPIDLVAATRHAIGPDATLLVDGGIRCPGDILKAIALGADAAMIGRPYLYALAAAGQAGVERLLTTWHQGVARNMALCGVRRVDEITAALVHRPQAAVPVP